jgi:hypothetical protein
MRGAGATREVDEHSISRAVIARLADREDPRFQQGMTSLVTNLHDFVRDGLRETRGGYHKYPESCPAITGVI